MDLQSLSLYPATPEQSVEADKRTWMQWGKDRGLTLEQYLAKERTMRSIEEAKDGKYMKWVLVLREDPETLDFLCSCTTYRRSGLLYRKGNSAVEHVVSYGIASVFTPKEKRGHGYASLALSLLHWVLAEPDFLQSLDFPTAIWGTPPLRVSSVGDARFSALWSDIGPSFYRGKCGPVPKLEGWVVKDPISTIWGVAGFVPKVPRHEWEWLDKDGIQELWKEDSAFMEEEMMRSAAEISVSFLPTEGVAARQHQRSQLLLPPKGPPIVHWGIQLDASYATWAVEVFPTSQFLVITRLRANEDTFVPLLDEIMIFAKKHEMQTVEVYNLPEKLQALAASAGGVAQERQEHLPSLMVYGERDVAWLFNERFAWC